MKQLLHIFLTFICCAHFSYAYAFEDTWEFALGAGVSFPDIEDATVNAGDGWPDDTFTEGDVDAAGIFSALAAYRMENDTQWFPAYVLGLNYLYGLTSSVSGSVQQFSLPQFENYQYEYDVQSQALFGLLKIEIYEFENLTPFISGGLGAAWNHFSDYHETANENVTPRVPPDYDNNTHSDFAFLLGIGVNYWFGVEEEEDWRVSLEYNYADLGNVSFEEGKAEITTSIVLLSVGYVL